MAFVRAGGSLDSGRGKGGHQLVLMPNGGRLIIPTGVLKVGTLAELIKEAGLTVDEFIKLL